jgi:hypothetical protein
MDMDKCLLTVSVGHYDNSWSLAYLFGSRIGFVLTDPLRVDNVFLHFARSGTLPQ